MVTAIENQRARCAPWLLALVFVVVAFAACQPVWHAGFVWDDDDHLTANPAMTAPHGLRMIWTSLAVSRYYPLTLTSFWVQRRVWELDPLPYHLVNVALHAIIGFVFFVTALLPVLGFFDVFYFRYSFVADHLQYLAGLGVIACVASATAHVSGGDKLWITPPGNALCAALLPVLGGLTWRQSHIYCDSGTLWRDTVQKNPGSWIAQNTLGLALWQAGSPDEAIGQYEQSLRINPDNAEARNNLGNVLFQAGRPDEAVVQHERAFRIDPDYAEAHYNLGNFLWQTGKSGEAIAQCEQALKCRADYAPAQDRLARLRAGR
jgi:tetratricopeptide repeat protein